MYGPPNNQDYFQSTLVPGLWKHRWSPVQFTLVVDNFGVKYVVEEHAQHLVDTIKGHYDIKTDWKGDKYIGVKLYWDYVKRDKSICPSQAILPKYFSSYITPSKKNDKTCRTHKCQWFTAPNNNL